MIQPTLASPAEQMFPQLTPAQVERIAAHGRVRPIQPGEVLVEAGDYAAPFFVVKTGRLEVVQPSAGGDTLVAAHGPGQFTGEVSMLSGRRTLVRSRAAESGEVVQLDRESLLTLVRADSELGEIILRAFILRRVELIAHGVSDAVVLGSNHCPGTLRVREFLARNRHPYSYIDLDRDTGVQELLDQFHVGVGDVPVLICRGEVVLRNPTHQQIADCLGFNQGIDRSHLRDLVVIGARKSARKSASRLDKPVSRPAAKR